MSEAKRRNLTDYFKRKTRSALVTTESLLNIYSRLPVCCHRVRCLKQKPMPLKLLICEITKFGTPRSSEHFFSPQVRYITCSSAYNVCCSQVRFIS